MPYIERLTSAPPLGGHRLALTFADGFTALLDLEPALEGPVDFRLDFVAAKNVQPAKKLRKERTGFPVITIVLLAAFMLVAYFAWKSLWQG